MINAEIIKEKRLTNIIEKIEREINEYIVGFGWSEIHILIPDDSFKSIKLYFNKKGFKIRRESFYYRDIDGYRTNDIGYNYYLSL